MTRNTFKILVTLNVAGARGDVNSNLVKLPPYYIYTVGNLEMTGRVSVFAESYRLYVPELKSVGLQCPILGQLMGTRRIQHGCHDPGKLQKRIHIYTTACCQHNVGIYTHALTHEEFNGTISNNVRLCSCDQNKKWPPFSLTIARNKHNLIDFCYINVFVFVSIPLFCHTRRVQRNYFQ